MVLIDNINTPVINNYRSMKKIHNDDSKEDSLFIAEGEKVVDKLLKSNIAVKSIFCNEDYFRKNFDLIHSKVKNEHNIFVADKSIMSEIVGYKIHSGVMAEATIPNKANLNEFNGNIVAFNSIIDTENVGTIVRSAAAFGFNNLIYDSSTSSPYLRRAVRVSLGNIFDMNFRLSDDLVAELLFLRNNLGYKIISAEITENSYPIHHIDFDSKFVLVFGNEGKGIQNSVLEISDYIVHIPIIEKVKSINVSVAAGIFFYDINNSRNRLCFTI